MSILTQTRLHSEAAEAEALANFVNRTGGLGHAFVENKFLGNKTGKLRLAMNPAFECGEPAFPSVALAARERDVGMVRAGLRDKPAKASRCGDELLKGVKLGCEDDSSKENSGALKEAQPFQLDRDRCGTQFAKPLHNAFVLWSIAQKLQGDVP